MDNILSILKTELEKYKLQDSSEAAEKMIRFMELVLKKNESINLTTITEEDEFIKRHLLDSIACFQWPEIENAETIVDVGTGAGFPGIPLAICYPKKRFVLLDSLGKRIDFVNDAVADLGLSNVKAVQVRAEDAGRNPALRETYDLCVTRAVAPFNVLLEYCLPLIKPGGFLYAYKTRKAVSEIEESSLALRLLGASTSVQVKSYGTSSVAIDANSEIDMNSEVSPYTLSIFIVEKLKSTPKEYPRKAGTPKKVPL